MTARETEKLLKKLLPRLPGFTVSRRFLFMCPIGHILRGFYFDRSSDPLSFYLHVFIQPLYIPRDSVVFLFGERLGQSWKYQADAEAELIENLLERISNEGLPVLKGIETPAQFAETIDQVVRVNPKDPHALRARAYSFVLAGEHENAIEIFDRLQTELAELEDEPLWLRELLQETQTFRQLLVHKPAEAKDKLYEWERYTLTNLRLNKFVEC